MLYLITYDLRAPGRDYDSLWKALRAIGARRVLESVWVTPNNGKSTKKIRDQLKQHIDDNDRLLVAEVDDWATRSAMIDMNELEA